MKILKKNEKGITVIVLVLTIVITLILVRVAISFILGDDGLLKNSIKGRIMNKVQSLDDSIKAYSIKNDDIYSSSKKGINDLESEGLIQKIPLTYGKSIYYVTNQGLDLLKLKFDNNDFLIDTTKTYSMEELKEKGIYVVDNSLNAAFLNDGQVYGKLINFGDDLNIADGKIINGKVVNIKPKKKVISNQEVVLVIDRTVSMGMYVTAQPTGDTIDTIPIVMENGEVNLKKGYELTRWAETVQAMDDFIDSFLPANNKLKKLTIFTYYGQDQGSLSVENLGTFTTAASAKSSYANIFTQNHYSTLIYNLLYGPNRSYYQNQLQQGNHFKYYRGNYYIDCRVLNGKYSYLYNTGYENYSTPTLGYGTCTPKALQEAYNYINSQAVNEIPMDVLIMSDGDANITLDFHTVSYYFNNTHLLNTQITNEITSLANNIIGKTIKDRTVGLYAVGFSPDARNFNSYFGGNITKYYSAEQTGDLAASFEDVFEEVNQKNKTVITDGRISDAYSNIVQIKIDVYSSKNSNLKRTFDYSPDGAYELSNIYANQMLNLKEAFDLIDSDPSITADYDTIDVNILYTVTEDDVNGT